MDFVNLCKKGGERERCCYMRTRGKGRGRGKRARRMLTLGELANLNYSLNGDL